MCKMRLTSLHDSSNHFIALFAFMKGTSCSVIKRDWRWVGAIDCVLEWFPLLVITNTSKAKKSWETEQRTTCHKHKWSNKFDIFHFLIRFFFIRSVIRSGPWFDPWSGLWSGPWSDLWSGPVHLNLKSQSNGHLTFFAFKQRQKAWYAAFSAES